MITRRLTSLAIRRCLASANPVPDPVPFTPSTSSERSSQTPSMITHDQMPFIDRTNKFLIKPQAWLTDLMSDEEPLHGIVDLHPEVFATMPRLDILQHNIVWQQQYRKITYIKQLTRAEMPGGGRKPWRQTGIGKSRQGSVRAPQWKSGGFAHGIRGPKTWFYVLPLAERIRGLCVALTIKHAQDDLVVTKDLLVTSGEREDLEKLAEARNWGYSVLFVDDTDVAPTALYLATQGTPGFNVIPVYGLNPLSITKHDTLVLTLRAVRKIESKILGRLHSPRSLLEPFNYKDWKETIDQDENWAEEELPPFV